MVSYEIEVDCASKVFWVVEPGDTLSLIAHESGFSLEEVLAVNPGVDPNNLVVGSKICLPEERTS